MTMPPRQDAHGVATDVLLAAVLLLVGESQVWLGWSDGGVGTVPDDQRAARALLLVAFVGPLVWRRRRPVAVGAVICAALVVQLVGVAPYLPFLAGLLPMMVAIYSSAAYARRWRISVLVMVFATEAVMFGRIPAERATGEVLFAVFVALGCWVAGDMVRNRLLHAERTLGTARTMLEESSAATAAALVEERARIARELHDVIAHSVSVMGVQAGAARTLMDHDLEAARETLLSVESTARASVAELQRLLAVLREDGADDAALAPQPGLGELSQLVDRMRDAGLPVEAHVRAPEGLPPGVDLAAFRIVQEALTNALKHGGGRTRVIVAVEHSALRLEVHSDGPVRESRVARGGLGHGLIGMRERVQLYGGTLATGPDPAGGFAVVAVLPVNLDRVSKQVS